MRQSIVIAIIVIAFGSVARAEETEALRPNAPEQGSVRGRQAQGKWYRCGRCFAVRVETTMPCPVCRSTVSPAPYVPTEWESCPVCASAYVETKNPRGSVFCRRCGIRLRQPTPRTLSDNAREFVGRAGAYRTEHFHGFFADRIIGYRNDVPGVERIFAEKHLRLEYAQSASDAVRFVCTSDARIDSTHLASGTDPIDATVRRSQWTLREAYGAYESAHAVVTVGQQIISWGKTDGVTPVDVMPQDLSDPPLHEQRSVPAVRVKWYASDAWTLDGFMSMARPTLLAPKGTRWFVAPFDSESMSADDAIEYGARLGVSKGSIDADAVVFDGMDRLPAIHFLSPFGIPAIVMHRIRMIGGDCATTIGSFGLRAETAYRTTKNDNGDRRLTSAVSIDRSWYDVVMDRDELHGVLAYAYEDVLREGRDIEFPRPFFNTVLGRIRYTFHDVHELSLDCTYTFDRGGKRFPAIVGGDSYVEPSYTWRPNERWTIRVGAGLMNGSPSSFWGSFTGNDRAFLDAQYNF